MCLINLNVIHALINTYRLILNAYGSNYLDPIQLKNLLLEQYIGISFIIY